MPQIEDNPSLRFVRFITEASDNGRGVLMRDYINVALKIILCLSYTLGLFFSFFCKLCVNELNFLHWCCLVVLCFFVWNFGEEACVLKW